MDFQKRPFTAVTNKELWQHTPPTLHDLFEDFINADCTHVLRQSTQNRYADDLDTIFNDELIGQFSSLSSADTYSNASTEPISIDEANAVAEHCFWETSFVHSPEAQTQVPTSSPILEDDYDQPQVSQRGVLGSDGEFLDLKEQLQAYLTKSEAGRIDTPFQAPPTPLSVPAKRVNTPRILRDSVQEGLADIHKPREVAVQKQAPRMMSAAPATQNTLWARRRGDPLVQNGTTTKPINMSSIDPLLLEGQRNVDARARGRQQTPYTFEHDYSNIIDGNPFFSDAIEPLSPFSTAYPGFSQLDSPITSPSLAVDPSQPATQTFFREVSYGAPQKNARGPSPYFSAPSVNGLPTPPTSHSAPQADWPTSTSPSFDDDVLSPAVYGFDFGFDQTAPRPIQPVPNQQPWLLQRQLNHQSTAGANINAVHAGMITNVNPAMMLDRAHSTSTNYSQANDASVYPPIFNHPNGPPVPTMPTSVAPRHLSLGNPVQPPPFSPTGMFSPSIPQMTLPPMPNTAPLSGPYQAHRHTSQPAISPHRHHQRSHTVAIATPSHLLSPRKTRSPTKSPVPASPGINKNTSPHRRSRSAHQRRKSSSQPPRGGRGGGGMVGFVNFTADDSQRLLNGVAPSGSSKTKARREKEAAVERKKLSEAAKKVVLEAGGDLNCLMDAGLLGSPVL